jgi:hypothetical protein
MQMLQRDIISITILLLVIGFSVIFVNPLNT